MSAAAVDWVNIGTLVVSCLTLLSNIFLHIQNNQCKSSCCKGWFEFEDNLQMQSPTNSPAPSPPPSPSIPRSNPVPSEISKDQ